MLIEDRIKLIIKANNQTPATFADEIGIKRSNLSHVLSGRNKPSLNFLSKIINSFPNVNASWLVTGVTREGEFVEEENTDPKSSIGEEHELEKADKIVVFYSDGTFREYRPNKK
jgi:transcriptional regulator with XRE-family HTH domain